LAQSKPYDFIINSIGFKVALKSLRNAGYGVLAIAVFPDKGSRLV
jgi:hypothetical protein